MYTVLIVEDDRSCRDSLKAALADMGYTVLTAANGDAALALLGSTAVQVIVSDLMMAPGDGLQLLDKVQRDYPDVPVILVSAFISPAVASDARSRGAHDVLPKPLDLLDLEAALASALASRG